MITILQDLNESLKAVLSGAASPAPSYSVDWVGNGGPANAVGSLNGTTAVTMLSGGPNPKGVKEVRIYNRDDADITVTLSKQVGATNYILVKSVVGVGNMLRWSDEGVRVVASSVS